MYFHYFVPIVAILLPGGTTSEVESHLTTFVKLCFLPKTSIKLNFESLKKSELPTEKYHAVIGNDVMQHKIFEFLTEKKENVSQEDFAKLCLKANLESVDDNGVQVGKFHGFQNATSNYTCEDSKDFPGVLRCNFESAFQEFDEDALTYFSTAKEGLVFEIDCFKSGQVGWALYSKTPKISEEDKKFYYAHAASLGFPENTNVILYSDHCVV